MKGRFFRNHSRLVLRSYLLLVAGLLAVAVTLQLGLVYLQSNEVAEAEPWLQATLDLAASELERTPVEQREAVARDLGVRIGMTVQLLGRDEVAGTSDSLEPLRDDNGDVWYLYAPPSLDALLYIGPAPETKESWLVRALPTIFYLSIFVVVGLWLRPLLTDIDRISSAARGFAADYREPLNTATETTELKGLAQNLDDMSTRISNLFQTQKELIAALSHEMRTPLARIRFALAVIDEQADQGVSAKIEALNEDVQEIDGLIATMLNYARLDHPDVNMHWQDVPVDAWLAPLVRKHERDDKTLELNDESMGQTVRMDPRLMSLAMSNLLSNAIRYSRLHVRVDVRQIDDNVEMVVQDDGNGIPGSDRDSVFKAFTRLDNSRNRETGGHGLGLAIVSRIAALHRGSVEVTESAELGGAAFKLRWPS